MATSVLSKEAGLKGKLERCEKRKKETRQNKKKKTPTKKHFLLVKKIVKF